MISLTRLHHPVLPVFILVVQCQLKLKFAERGPPLPLPLLRCSSLVITGVERGGGALRDHALVPVPVVLQCVQNVLCVRVDQVCPRLPQRVDNVVDEADLDGDTKMSVKMYKTLAVYTRNSVCVLSLPAFSPLRPCVCRTWGWSPSPSPSLYLPGGRTRPWSCPSTAGTGPEAWWGCWGQHSGPCYAKPAAEGKKRVVLFFCFLNKESFDKRGKTATLEDMKVRWAT